MKITLSGRIGSGKSTVARIVAKKLNFSYYSIGLLLGELALKKGMTLMKISKLAENNEEIDEYLDKRQKEIGMKEKIIMDSRLGFHFIPDSFKVFLNVSLDEGARRVFKDKSNRKDERISSMKKLKEEIKEREKSESFRYKKYYDVNPFDMSNYDLVIDTTKLSAEEAAEMILKALNS